MKPLKLKLFQELFERVRPDEQMETHPVSFNRLPFLFLSEAHHIFVVNLNLLSEQLMKTLFYRKLKLSLFSLRSTSCTSGLTTFLWSTNLRGSFSGLESTVSLFSLFIKKSLRFYDETIISKRWQLIIFWPA
jgi:hypothetical protein